MMRLLYLFFVPFGVWRYTWWLGLALLPLVVVVGLLAPRAAFGLAVWDYVLLLALPFSLTGSVLRGLVCNRSLALVPGLAHQAVLAALLFTVLQSVFIAGFAYWFDIPGQHLRAAAGLFMVGSLYSGLMYWAYTTGLALAAVSVLPVIWVAMVLYVTQGEPLLLLGDDHVLALVVVTLFGWILAWYRTRQTHGFRPAHASVWALKTTDYRRMQLAHWLVSADRGHQAPLATLLLGHAGDLVSRIRALLFQVFLGPLVATAFLVTLGVGPRGSWHASALEILLGTALLPLTFGVFQGVDWVARLRLFWLRSPLNREHLWSLLETQLAIHVLLLTVIAVALALLGLAFTRLPAAVLVHYPLLVIAFNALYAMFMVFARTQCWSPAWGMLAGAVMTALLCGALWLGLDRQVDWPLFAIELVAGCLALGLRRKARGALAVIDWLVVKPDRLAKLAN